MVQHGPGLGLEDGQEINRHQIGVVFLAFRCRSLPLCTFIGERINTGLWEASTRKATTCCATSGVNMAPRGSRK